MDWDWIAFGTWLAVAYVCAFAFVGAALALRRYRRVAAHTVAAALFFACVGTVVAQKGGGTNEPPRLAARPVRAAAQTPRPSAPAKVAKINARGAWRDSFLLDFGDGFLFPFGTNRLSSVEIFSQGYARPRRRSSEIVADTGLRAAIVPGVSSISVELTPSNSWRVVWTDAAQNRDTNTLVSASIELMRSGDVAVTTNGVTRTIPRELPFPHDGFGQDGEWVAANFTNATEIAAAGGYAQWVDAQVGSGLTNGLYKFTVTIADTPPETVQLVVGDFSVAVTNAGEYVFLLEKGRDYRFGTIPYFADVAYSAEDDVPLVMRGLRSASDGGMRRWTTDGGLAIEAPTETWLGNVCWMPLFFGYPDILHFGPAESGMEFEAVIVDWSGNGAISYQWTVGEGMCAESSGEWRTAVHAEDLPSWAESSISVRATLNGHVLTSSLEGITCGTNDIPQVHLSLSIPDAILLNSNETSAAKVAAVGWSFSSDVPTSGVVRVWCESGADKVVCSGLEGAWAVSGETGGQGTLEGVSVSGSLDDVVFLAEFTGEGGSVSVSHSTTVVRTGNIRLPSAPEDGLVTLRGTSVTVSLDCDPQNAGSRLATLWYVRRLRSDGSFESWQLAGPNYDGADAVLTPNAGGVYQVRALASASGGGTDERYYIWETDENPATGLKKVGDIKAFGVCNEQWQIDLRNCARTYLGSTQYARNSAVNAQYGYSEIMQGAWKCNIFLAHSIMRAGLSVPHNCTMFNVYPPVANDWANGTGIYGWTFIGRNVFVQPGYVIGHPATTGSGHCGIVDFDGIAIAAGEHNVNRRYKMWLDGASGFHTYVSQ